MYYEIESEKEREKREGRAREREERRHLPAAVPTVHNPGHVASGKGLWEEEEMERRKT